MKFERLSREEVSSVSFFSIFASKNAKKWVLVRDCYLQKRVSRARIFL